MSESNFEWDQVKNLSNQKKHGVSFYEAQYAFFDQNRIIAEDVSHSKEEKRYYCFGLDKDQTGILTVRFTYRDNRIRIIGAGYWRKGKSFMSKQIQYTDEPIGEVKLVADFLPSPSELKVKNDSTKITITLSSDSIEYFKSVAEEHGMQYQKMIRQLLDEYVAHQRKNSWSTPLTGAASPTVSR